MPKYELCIVSREYRYVEIEAENQSEAIDAAWGQVADGIVGHTQAHDYDTDVYLESEIKEKQNA